MRPLDLAGAALVLAAGLFIVEATWTPPLVATDEAAQRIGERVRVEGMALEVRRFGDGSGRFVLAAAGSALHVRMATIDVQDNDWVRLEGTMRREAGLPLLEAEASQVLQRPDVDRVQLGAIAQDPAAYIDRLLQVQGFVQRGELEDDGHRLLLMGESSNGFQAVSGVLRYEPRCLCHALHVAPWT